MFPTYLLSLSKDELSKPYAKRLPCSILFQPPFSEQERQQPAVIYLHGWNDYPYSLQACSLGSALATQGYLFLSLGMHRRGVEGQMRVELKGPENGERMLNYYFTAPLTSTTDKFPIRSGNLEVLRFEGSLPNKLNYSRPGSLGACLYTMKVRDIESYHQRVSSSEATEVTKVCENEFGEKSFSFVAHDGYFWTLLE